VCSRVLFVSNQQLRCQPKLVAYSQLVFAWLSRYPTLLCQLGWWSFVLRARVSQKCAR